MLWHQNFKTVNVGQILHEIRLDFYFDSEEKREIREEGNLKVK